MKKRAMQVCRLFFCAYFSAFMVTPLYAQSGEPHQNAVLEGVQFSSEETGRADEVSITWYFIFRDKPSSYFYEIKKNPLRLVFEFYDTEKGTAPIPSQEQAPVRGFEIEQTEVDMNKDVQGLRPDLRDVVKVSLMLDAVPEISVTDEYNVISFQYPWTTDYSKINKYTVKDNTMQILLWSLAGIGVGGIATVGYVVLNPPPPTSDELDISDLPVHDQYDPF